MWMRESRSLDGSLSGSLTGGEEGGRGAPAGADDPAGMFNFWAELTPLGGPLRWKARVLGSRAGRKNRSVDGGGQSLGL